MPQQSLVLLDYNVLWTLKFLLHITRNQLKAASVNNSRMEETIKQLESDILKQKHESEQMIGIFHTDTGVNSSLIIV